MKLAPDSTGTTDARAMLDQLPGLYVTVLKNTRIEQMTGGDVRCSFEVPELGKRSTTAPTALQAVRAALLELTDALTKLPPDEWPEAWRRPVPSPAATQDDAPSREGTETGRFRAKSRQFTVGVTMPVGLKMSLQQIAQRQKVRFAEVAREFTGIGYEDFDERSYSEGSAELLSALSAELRKWRPSNTEQVMVRVDPHLAARLRSTAKEYRRSVSEFGAMCLAHGLVLQEQLVELEQKVAAYRGAAIRKLAPQVGLGTQAALLSGILAGTIRAPRMVLRRLSEVLEAPPPALTEFFKRSFERLAVPAFKAENGKPQVIGSVISWEEAVKSLNLPADQAKELRQLDA